MSGDSPSPEPSVEAERAAESSGGAVRETAERYLSAAGEDMARALLLAVEDVLTLRRAASFGLMRGQILNIERQTGDRPAFD